MFFFYSCSKKNGNDSENSLDQNNSLENISKHEIQSGSNEGSIMHINTRENIYDHDDQSEDDEDPIENNKEEDESDDQTSDHQINEELHFPKPDTDEENQPQDDDGPTENNREEDKPHNQSPKNRNIDTIQILLPSTKDDNVENNRIKDGIQDQIEIIPSNLNKKNAEQIKYLLELLIQEIKKYRTIEEKIKSLTENYNPDSDFLQYLNKDIALSSKKDKIFMKIFKLECDINRIIFFDTDDINKFLKRKAPEDLKIIKNCKLNKIKQLIINILEMKE